MQKSMTGSVTEYLTHIYLFHASKYTIKCTFSTTGYYVESLYTHNYGSLLNHSKWLLPYVIQLHGRSGDVGSKSVTCLLSPFPIVIYYFIYLLKILFTTDYMLVRIKSSEKSNKNVWVLALNRCRCSFEIKSVTMSKNLNNNYQEEEESLSQVKKLWSRLE